MERLDLRAYMDAVVFCRDVGWRKPAKEIFEFTLKKLLALPHQCIFVGDDPRWDLVGPRAVGIETILIDRQGVMQHVEEEPKPIKSLNELLDKLQLV